MKIDAIGSMGGGINSYAAAKTTSDTKFADVLEAEAQKAKEQKESAKLMEACRGFEAMFLNFMYEKMRDTVPDNTLFGTTNADKILQSMLDTELTKNMAEAGGIGLADMMFRQLSQTNKA